MAEAERVPLDGSLTLVIPVHNEAANMSLVVGGSVVALGRLAFMWEIVLVDDGSTDETVAAARVLAMYSRACDSGKRSKTVRPTGSPGGRRSVRWQVAFK